MNKQKGKFKIITGINLDQLEGYVDLADFWHQMNTDELKEKIKIIV